MFTLRLQPVYCAAGRLLQNGDMKSPAYLQWETTARVKVAVPREAAWKLWKKLNNNHLKIKIDGSLNHVLFIPSSIKKPAMPNVHAPDKEPLSLQIPRTLMGRLKSKAKVLGMTFPHYIIMILTNETHNTTLTSQDYEAIARATKEAERSGRRSATRFNDPA
jgi:predicted DNA binding CopG/RHH family protein